MGIPHDQVHPDTLAAIAADLDNMFFDENGMFRSVEMATTHAIVVQGGFTTPEIEARRMVNDKVDTRYSEMGQAWLDAN